MLMSKPSSGKGKGTIMVGFDQSAFIHFPEHRLGQHPDKSPPCQLGRRAVRG